MKTDKKEIELEQLITEYEKNAKGKTIVFYGKNAFEECQYFTMKYDISYYTHEKPKSDRFYTIDTDAITIKRENKGFYRL